MLRKSIFAAVAAALAALLTPGYTHAWGARHVGYTHVGPNGVQHYGATAAVGPYGAYSGAHASSYGYGGYHAGGYNAYGYGGGYGGAYHYNAGYGGAYNYNTGYGGGYHYGAVGVGGGGYAGGVYRRY